MYKLKDTNLPLFSDELTQDCFSSGSYITLYIAKQFQMCKCTVFSAGATGGVKKESDNKEKHVRLDSVKGDSSHTRNSPTSSMSYSVPNLPASMDNLLETFAAVARRNAGNNMLRSNAVSLARLLPPNSSSK